MRTFCRVPPQTHHAIAESEDNLSPHPGSSFLVHREGESLCWKVNFGVRVPREVPIRGDKAEVGEPGGDHRPQGLPLPDATLLKHQMGKGIKLIPFLDYVPHIDKGNGSFPHLFFTSRFLYLEGKNPTMVSSTFKLSLSLGSLLTIILLQLSPVMKSAGNVSVRHCGQ